MYLEHIELPKIVSPILLANRAANGTTGQPIYYFFFRVTKPIGLRGLSAKAFCACNSANV